MHELSIAIEIVEIATEEALKANASGVSKLELSIGKLSGIMPDALEFAMEEAVKNSMLEHVKVVYHYIDAKAACQECCNEFHTDDYFKVCPACNSMNTYFIQGKELNIKSIDIEQIRIHNNINT
jgi:hydrogenase nickel incorporation protein HypA/HybF